jgi:hypothetical protein
MNTWSFKRILVPLLLTVIVAVSVPLAAIADDVGSSNKEGANESSSTEAQDAELPPSLQRLFGESVPFPDPDSTGYELYALAMHDAYVNTTGGANRGGGIVGNLFCSRGNRNIWQAAIQGCRRLSVF